MLQAVQWQTRVATAAVAALAAIGIAAPTLPSAAQSDSDSLPSGGVELDVLAGVDGLHRPGKPVPLTIELRAEQLITGELQVTSRVGRRTLRHELGIEVPGSSTKRFVLTAPTPIFEIPEIAVSLKIDGATVASHDVDLEVDPTVELVGVMPLLADPDTLPDRAALAIDAGTARLEPITPELLGAGLDALLLFDAIAATAADLEALSGSEFDAVAGWVVRGGHLLVDEQAGTVPRLPTAWQPSEGHPAPAGLGLVRLTGGAAKASQWDRFLLPTPLGSDNDAGSLDPRFFGESLFGSLSADLSRDAGFDLPEITELFLFLVLYGLVVGPVSYVILRRRQQQTLLWITIPAFAMIATVGVYILGSELRGNTRTSHATIVVTGPGVDVATTHVLVDRKAGGIAVPRGWTPTLPPRDSFNNFMEDDSFGAFMEDQGDFPSPDMEVRPDGNGALAIFGLKVGEFAVATARGPVEVAGLEVSASSPEDGRIEGTVTNTSDVTITDIGVFSSRSTGSLGTLGPGESRELVLADVDELTLDEGASMLWHEGGPLGSAISAGLWDAGFSDRGGVNAHPLGTVMVAGWTTGLDAPVTTADGSAITAGRTLLISQDTIASADGPPTNMATRIQMVRGPADTDIGDNSSGQPYLATYQGLVPDTGNDRLVVHIPRYVSDIDIWRDGSWRALETTGEERDAVLPVDQVTVGGLVHLRVLLDPNRIVEFGNGRVTTIAPLADE